jgi:hypothetical protein
MTLDILLTLQLSYDELKKLWLVFDSNLKNRLEEVQPSGQHQVSPIELKDGNYAVCADVLSEIQGIYAKTFASLDQSTFSNVKIVNENEIIIDRVISVNPLTES